MSNDPIEASTTSETEPTANYSRWMTDLETEISHLKLYQLAIPGAHNSGVDKSGTWGPWEDWGACQINSFPQQLAAGARFLDLRLLDDSYKKTTGNHSPITRFYEVFQFNHGLAKAGRRLEHLIRDVKNFVTANPREIVILNFRHYDKNKWPDSLERCLPYFNPIKNLLIPKTAHDLTINDIRKLYPSRSIILAFDHGTPQTWKPEWVQREQLWSLIHYYWNLDDSEEAIEKLVVESMLSPPLEAYWVLSAAARDNRGPKLLPPHHPIRVETFSPGKQNGNIILVDFVEKKRNDY